MGLANKFAMCTENSGGVNQVGAADSHFVCRLPVARRDVSSVRLPQDHHDSPIGLASTIAHEMGHNFGLSHDDPDCVCSPSYSSKDCIMADKLRLVFNPARGTRASKMGGWLTRLCIKSINVTK